jgi:hypothetical protein
MNTKRSLYSFGEDEALTRRRAEGFDFEWTIATATPNVGPSGPVAENGLIIVRRR